MPIDVSKFIVQQPNWGGLYKAADTLEKERLLQRQTLNQQMLRRQASANFLAKYLDPKDLLSGTAVDPMIVQGLHHAMQQGAYLASQGADNATLLMALAPTVSKLSDYSVKAKGINKQVDDTISKLKENGYTGYDFAKLKQQALKNAFFDTDPNTGQSQLNPDKADPSTNWVLHTVQENPEAITTGSAFDRFAKSSPKTKTTSDVSMYSPTGALNKRKVNLIGQSWLVPDVDKNGATTGMVPKYEMAGDNGEPIMHDFKDASGKTVRAPVRLLDENVFDALPPDAIDYLKGQVKQHLDEYETNGGQRISMDDPRAKLIARALAYNELNQRKAATIENAETLNKPSATQARMAAENTPEYLNMLRRQAEARAQGRQAVTGETSMKPYKDNAIQAAVKIMRNDPEYTGGDTQDVDFKNIGKRNVIDVTNLFPGGGLKSGRGESEKFKNIYYDPRARSFIIDKQVDLGYGLKDSDPEEIPEGKVPQFLMRIATANGVPLRYASQFIKNMGFKNGKFQGVDNTLPEKLDFERRQEQINKKKNFLQRINPFS